MCFALFGASWGRGGFWFSLLPFGGLRRSMATFTDITQLASCVDVRERGREGEIKGK